MAHVISDLMAAAVAALTGLASTGANVFAERDYDLQAAELPALLLEESEEVELMGEVQRRNVSLHIEAVAKVTSALGNTLRQICSEVEAALGAGLTVQGKVVELVYQGAAPPDRSVASDRPVGVRRMTFLAILHTARAVPATVL